MIGECIVEFAVLYTLIKANNKTAANIGECRAQCLHDDIKKTKHKRAAVNVM